MFTYSNQFECFSHMCTFYWLHFKNIFYGSRLQFPDRIRFKSFLNSVQIQCRSSHPEVFLGKLILTIRSKFTGENPCRSATSINLQSNFIEIALRHEVSPVNWLHIFRTPFPKNISGWLLLSIIPRNQEFPLVLLSPFFCIFILILKKQWDINLLKNVFFR